jgi:hypothetical protein
VLGIVAIGLKATVRLDKEIRVYLNKGYKRSGFGGREKNRSNQNLK